MVRSSLDFEKLEMIVYGVNTLEIQNLQSWSLKYSPRRPVKVECSVQYVEQIEVSNVEFGAQYFSYNRSLGGRRRQTFEVFSVLFP